MVRILKTQKKPTAFKDFATLKDQDDRGEPDEKECVICFDVYEQDAMIIETHCHHLFHDACLVKWIERKLTAK